MAWTARTGKVKISQFLLKDERKSNNNKMVISWPRNKKLFSKIALMDKSASIWHLESKLSDLAEIPTLVTRRIDSELFFYSANNTVTLNNTIYL
jgi:hypothetical protein